MFVPLGITAKIAKAAILAERRKEQETRKAIRQARIERAVKGKRR